MRPIIRTKLPGPRSTKILTKLKRLNLGYNDPYPFVQSNKGQGCYFSDLDKNLFLDFASHVASNPLGYNHPALVSVVKKYSDTHPIKYAGQDFCLKEHSDLLEELVSITPKGLNSAFLVNSGAEAVENCIKVALRKQKKAKFGISFKGAFHGRTLGALSCTDSKPIQKKNFLFIPMKTIPFDETSIEKINRIVKKQESSKNVGFIIIEAIQGEGGYNVAPKKLMTDLRSLTKKHGIPLIIDEVQSGMGRTGKWWAFEHYNIKPDIFSAAKALQVGATISSKKFSVETGTISSTWGGGHTLDLALGLKTIQLIKKNNLLKRNTKMGNYMIKRLNDIGHASIKNVRGKGLMIAFDLPSNKIKNYFIIECLQKGLVLLGCGDKGIRLLPPYVVSKEEIDVAVKIIEEATAKTVNNGFKHKGRICNYLTCGEVHG